MIIKEIDRNKTEEIKTLKNIFNLSNSDRQKFLTFGAVFTKVKLVPKRVGFWSMFNKYRLLN